MLARAFNNRDQDSLISQFGNLMLFYSLFNVNVHFSSLESNGARTSFQNVHNGLLV